MRSETEVRLALTPPPGSEALRETLAEAHFAERHEAWWTDAAHPDGTLVVLTSAEPMLSFPTIGEFVLSCWAAVPPLAFFAWETGVGPALDAVRERRHRNAAPYDAPYLQPENRFSRDG